MGVGSTVLMRFVAGSWSSAKTTTQAGRWKASQEMVRSKLRYKLLKNKELHRWR